MQKVWFWRRLSSTGSRAALTSSHGAGRQTTFLYLKGAGKAGITYNFMVLSDYNTRCSLSGINTLYSPYCLLLYNNKQYTTYIHIKRSCKFFVMLMKTFFFPKRCFSSVGNQRVGKQTLSIGTNCDRIATIEHEFLHALGFWHEQSRSDRDDYVKIMWDYILDGTEPLNATCYITYYNFIKLRSVKKLMH